jgi:predicted TIM-barrel fold metal-dependent hydrolase
MSWIVEHTGWPTATDPETFKAWRNGMEIMAACPNAAAKISGLSMALHRWTTEDLRPWIEATVEVFGTGRCMFASNFPVDWIYSEFATLLDAFSEITSGYSKDERQALFVTNAERWYRI